MDLNINLWEISIEHYLILAALVFSLGAIGLLMPQRNVITILMSIEIMLLAVGINLVTFSVYLQNINGLIFSILILAIAAAEIAIGLAILVIYFRNKRSIELEDINQLRG